MMDWSRSMRQILRLWERPEAFVRFGDTAVGQATGRSPCDASVNAGSAGGKPGSRCRPGAARRVTYSAPTGPVPVATVPDPDGLLVLLTPAGLPGARSELTACAKPGHLDAIRVRSLLESPDVSAVGVLGGFPGPVLEVTLRPRQRCNPGGPGLVAMTPARAWRGLERQPPRVAPGGGRVLPHRAGVDVWVGGTQLRVGDDAVADLKAGGLGELDVGRDPDADDDRVGLDVGSVGQPHAVSPAARSGDLRDLDTEAEVDAVIAVQAGEDLRRLPAEHPQQRQLAPFQDRHLHADGPRGGSGLQADPARPDHHNPRYGGKGGLDLVAVRDPAQVEHAAGFGAGNGQAAWCGAGGQQQLRVANTAAVGECHLVLRHAA